MLSVFSISILTSNLIFTGGRHHRFKRGYKNVIDEAIRLVMLISHYVALWICGTVCVIIWILRLLGAIVIPSEPVFLGKLPEAKQTKIGF